MKKRFEYKTLKTKEKGFWKGTIDTEELELYLNKLGFEGWELVASVETNAGHGSTNEILLLFKREFVE